MITELPEALLPYEIWQHWVAVVVLEEMRAGSAIEQDKASSHILCPGNKVAEKVTHFGEILSALRQWSYKKSGHCRLFQITTQFKPPIARNVSLFPDL